MLRDPNESPDLCESEFICKMEQIPPTSHDYKQEQVISVMIPYIGNVYFI